MTWILSSQHQQRFAGSGGAAGGGGGGEGDGVKGVGEAVISVRFNSLQLPDGAMSLKLYGCPRELAPCAQQQLLAVLTGTHNILALPQRVFSSSATLSLILSRVSSAAGGAETRAANTANTSALEAVWMVSSECWNCPNNSHAAAPASAVCACDAGYGPDAGAGVAM